MKTSFFTLLVAGLAALALLAATPVFGQVGNQITAVSPNSAAPGTSGLTVTFTLDTDSPPAPPTSNIPDTVTIGSLVGTSVAHPSQYTVTAMFDIPSNEAVSAKDCVVTFTTPQGSVPFSVSGGFTVTVGTNTPPSILQEPKSDLVPPGEAATFSVSASGTQPLFYQWQKDTTNLAGQTNSSYTIATATNSDDGDYRCIVSNAFGVVTSTVASLTVTDVRPYEGYNLYSPLTSTNTYLMDNYGNIVHTWSSDYRPGLSAYLLEDGSLIRTANTGSTNFNTGGAGGRVERYDWNGNLTWAYDYSTSTNCQHHDIAVLPNGHILMIAWELKTQTEALAAGRDPGLLTDGQLWADSVIEVAPTGAYGGTIVWQWHVWDHLVQDYSPSESNYGVVADHPELINLNYALNGGADWTHINSIDYNSNLDEIVLSVHNFGEIWVIDHSTTTAEAAGHTGGKQGKGGDLLYRWGNPAAYDSGSAADQQLFGQHDAEWIADGLPGAGDILIFNNGQGRAGSNYSAVDEIVTPVDASGGYTNTIPYGPLSPVWTYPSVPDTNFFAVNISSAQRLPNGSTLICDGPAGRFFEVSTNGDTVWDYDYGSSVFRVKRYGFGYAGINGTGLDPTEVPEFPYTIVDTAQTNCYDTNNVIATPSPGQPYYGQDAQYRGNQPVYVITDNGLTVHDSNTGLTWQRSPDTDRNGVINAADKLTHAELSAYADSLNAENYAGHNDWRVPSIKELYSLIDFCGGDPSSYTGGDTSVLTPFINTNVFDFAYGDTNAGDRIIDAQYGTSTLYVSTTMDGNKTCFGVNFADGRIKGYPANDTGSGPNKAFYVICVRGNTDYGVNSFTNNGDGTITDDATGLMWAQNDSGVAMGWAAALAYVEQLNATNYLGHNDWRLPNIKELQSILDYTRSPDTTASAAMNPIFNATAITNEGGVLDWGWYWSGTTHCDWMGNGSTADYMAFGRAMGYWNSAWEDVHGAGAQRSDPKGGSLTDYTYTPYGYYNSVAPQGDAVRISNFVRVVRDAHTIVDSDGDGLSDADELNIYGTDPHNPDTDGDGLSDGAEIVAGTDPLSSTSYLFVGVSQVVSNTASLCWPSVAGRTYYLEGTTNLSSGVWETNAVYDAVPPTNTIDLIVTNSPYFFRLRVEDH